VKVRLRRGELGNARTKSSCSEVRVWSETNRGGIEKEMPRAEPFFFRIHVELIAECNNEVLVRAAGNELG
jgi:hypothetical protein